MCVNKGSPFHYADRREIDLHKHCHAGDEHLFEAQVKDKYLDSDVGHLVYSLPTNRCR